MGPLPCRLYLTLHFGKYIKLLPSFILTESTNSLPEGGSRAQRVRQRERAVCAQPCVNKDSQISKLDREKPSKVNMGDKRWYMNVMLHLRLPLTNKMTKYSPRSCFNQK